MLAAAVANSRAAGSSAVEEPVAAAGSLAVGEPVAAAGSTAD